MEENFEREAARLGGKMGGEYLESLGKYNLIELSKEEYQTFIECVCKEYHLRHAEFQSKLQDCPF